MPLLARYAGFSAILLLSLGQNSNALALDTERFIELASATVHEANIGFISNVHKLIKIQEDLMRIGVEGAKTYIEDHPEHADMMNEVIRNAEGMKRMSLDEIEDQWHLGKYLKAKGYDLESLDQFGEFYGLMDAIIHPATAYICLKEYKRTRNAKYLMRASAVLSEVLLHIKHLDSAQASNQLSSN